MLVIIFLAVGYATITGGTFRTKTRVFAAPITGLSLPGVSSSIPTTDQSVLRPPGTNKTLRAAEAAAPRHLEVATQLVRISATPTQEPKAPVEDALVRAASVAPTPEQKAYTVYEVQSGDTVSSIAARSGVTTESIVANNAEIVDSDVLKLGQSLIIPVTDGIVHEVRYGETLSSIAARFGVDVPAITSFSANHITKPDDIKEAQYVFVPGGKQPARAAAAPESGASPAGGAASGGGTGVGAAATGPRSSSGLIWPVSGPISSPYGPSHPLGIDIDGYRLAGAAVGAATDGVVVFAGGNACCSYGLYVVVMSPGGIETLYAHLSSITVTQGERVAQGEKLGVIGSSGYSTGTHLHFEVIDHGVRQNPAAYLP